MRPSILGNVVCGALSWIALGACFGPLPATQGDPASRPDAAAQPAEATCSDGAENGTETDVDCGGDACGACIGGKRCKSASDCLSNACNDGVCATALVIAAISPRSGSTTGGTPVTIEGDDFKEGLTVTVDGARADVTKLTRTQLVVTLPPRPGKVGRVDVAIVNPDQKTAIAKNGFGYAYATTSFVEQEKRPVSYKPFSIASGDFDKDGNRDLAVANDNGQSVSVLLGRGDGTFPLPAGASKFAEYPVGNLSICVVAADLDGDGNEDLIVTNDQGNRTSSAFDIKGDVSVLFGKGDGTFSAETIYLTGRGPSAVVVEDFDKDGIKDLAVLNADEDTVALLRGLGKGAFQPYPQQSRFPSGSSSRYLALADFNHDGLPDLAVAGQGGSISVLTGQAGGTFPTTKPPAYSAGTGTYFVATGDLNDDGTMDIVTADRGYDQSNPGTVTTLIAKKNGTFPLKGGALPAGRDPRSVTLGDLNGDGFLDIVVTNYADDTLGVLLGTGDGQFLPAVTVPIQPAGGATSGPCSVVIDDLNDDGRNDLAVTNCAGNSVSILLNESH